MKLTGIREEELQSTAKTHSIKVIFTSAMREAGERSQGWARCVHALIYHRWVHTRHHPSLSHSTSQATEMRHSHLSISNYSGGTLVQ